MANREIENTKIMIAIQEGFKSTTKNFSSSDFDDYSISYKLNKYAITEVCDTYYHVAKTFKSGLKWINLIDEVAILLFVLKKKNLVDTYTTKEVPDYLVDFNFKFMFECMIKFLNYSSYTVGTLTDYFDISCVSQEFIERSKASFIATINSSFDMHAWVENFYLDYLKEVFGFETLSMEDITINKEEYAPNMIYEDNDILALRRERIRKIPCWKIKRDSK